MNEIIVRQTGTKIVKLREMEPMSIGRIMDRDGHIVMRTATECYFEVMNLSCPGVGWGARIAEDSIQDLMVELLPNTKLIVELG